MDFARYISWLGERGTVAAISMQPYLSAINKFLQDHARRPVAPGPLVLGVRKGLEECQHDDKPTPERLPLPAPVAVSRLEGGADRLPVPHRPPPPPPRPRPRPALAAIAVCSFCTRGE